MELNGTTENQPQTEQFKENKKNSGIEWMNFSSRWGYYIPQRKIPQDCFGDKTKRKMVFVVVILFLINTNPQVLDQPNKLSLYIKWVHTETALDYYLYGIIDAST